MKQQIILEPGRADRRYWFDLWNYRELLFFLAWRDVAVHYKQTVIGASWALIRPLLTTLILTIVFNKVAKLPADDNLPYPLFVLSGTIVWQLFASFLSDSSNSLVTNANLVSKVYFPRMLVPLSTIGVPLVDLFVLLPILGVMMAIYQVAPAWQCVLAPLFLIFAAATAAGFGLMLCALNVRFRDVRYIIPFIIQFGVYLSPIGYGISRVPEEYRIYMYLNPLTFAIDGMRWSIFGTGSPFEHGYWLLSAAVTMIAIVVGIRYFRQTEKTFADVI